MKAILNDAQMRKFHEEIEKSYPWIIRNNTVYSASLVSLYQVDIRDNDPIAAEALKKVINM